MYSRSYSSKKGHFPGEANTDRDDSLRIPPRYGGVRFVKEHRDDGRDEVFERTFVPMVREGQERDTEEKNELITDVFDDPKVTGDGDTHLASGAFAPQLGENGIALKDEEESSAAEKSADGAPVDQNAKKSKLGDLFSDFGQDDILIVALIVLLASQGSENNRDIILLLALLLCFR